MEVISGVRVRMRHIRAARLCSGGTRDWFRHHGLNWSEFLSKGLPVEEFEKTGDKMAIDVANIARAEHG